MNKNELIAEVKRLHRVIREANERAVVAASEKAMQNELIDKLTAASIRVQLLLKKLSRKP